MNFLKNFGKKVFGSNAKETAKEASIGKNVFYKKVKASTINSQTEDDNKPKMTILEKIEGIDRIMLQKSHKQYLLNRIKYYTEKDKLNKVTKRTKDSCEFVKNIFSLNLQLHYAIVNEMPALKSDITQVHPEFDFSGYKVIDEEKYAFSVLYNKEFENPNDEENQEGEDEPEFIHTNFKEKAYKTQKNSSYRTTGDKYKEYNPENFK